MSIRSLSLHLLYFKFQNRNDTHWAVFDLVEFTISSKTHTGKSFQLSQFVMSGAALTLPHPQQTLQENVLMQADRYENIDGEQDYPGDQVTS